MENNYNPNSNYNNSNYNNSNYNNSNYNNSNEKSNGSYSSADYSDGINQDDYKNKNASNSKLVDIRIVLTNLDYIEAVSKAVSNFDLSNFNVNISSIIPTDDIEIAKNTIIGADLVLIASEDRSDFAKFKKALRTDYNFIEYLKLPSLEEYGNYDYNDYEDNVFEDEIANSIIRGGLYSISNLSSINKSKRAYHHLKRDFEDNKLKIDKLTKENELLLDESKVHRERNEKLNEELKILQRELDSIKSDFSDLKSRFDSIHSKNSLEVFSLAELWDGLFNESLTEETYRFILISTDNFRPKNLMIGQGAICAESREDALDWLKIIKTAFILSDTNKKEFDFNNFNSNLKFDELDEIGSALSGSYSSHSDDLSESYSSRSDDLSRSFSPDSDDLSRPSYSAASYGVDKSYDSSSDDGFIYNERFEGNDEFRDIDFNEDFNLSDDNLRNPDNNADGSDSNENADFFNVFNQNTNEKKSDDDINVFNLKRTLNSIDENEEEDNDYSFDDGDVDEEDDDYSPFSNFWA